MNLLESFLSVTPSLEHLTLIDTGSLTDNNLFNGLRWGKFLQENKYFLEKFQFFLLLKEIVIEVLLISIQ